MFHIIYNLKHTQSNHYVISLLLFMLSKNARKKIYALKVYNL